jgi:uncharacterized protein (DUF934 family)
MPRQLLRDGRIVADDWQYLAELEAGTDGAVSNAIDGAGANGTIGTGGVFHTGGGIPALIVPFARWLTERVDWLSRVGRLGVVLKPADKVEQLAPDVERLALIAAEFPGPTDGRGYTQGRLLRERYGFTGELRAAGYVRRDQLFFLARCGFNSFELPEAELGTALSAFSTFSAEYQPSNDAGLVRKLQHR